MMLTGRFALSGFIYGKSAATDAISEQAAGRWLLKSGVKSAGSQDWRYRFWRCVDCH